MRPETRTLQLVRALLGGGVAARTGERFALPDGPSAPASEILPLISSGALAGDGYGCRANKQTRAWLRRRLLDADAFAAQHRVAAKRADDLVVNLAESPLARLASTATGEAGPFLARHHVEAGERVRALVARAQLQPKLTMSYTGALTAGGQRGKAGEISDMAADARRALDAIHRLLPPDCAGVVMDVCGLLKGLQTVEAERGWPRRSAKLVLRIGLEQLAQFFGYAAAAVGVESRKRRAWMGEGARPARFE